MSQTEISQPSNVRELGDYGFQLLWELSVWAKKLGLNKESTELEELSLPLALWVIDHGRELQTLEPVVNAIASMVNRTQSIQQLENLFQVINSIVNGVLPEISQNIEDINPHRPWRILLLNRAIVATRTCQPTLIEVAFGTIVEYLTEDTASFFSEGIEQMDKYFRLYANRKTRP